MGRALFIGGGLALVLASSCAGLGTCALGLEAATHPQSPIRSPSVGPRSSVREELDLSLDGYASDELEIELARYVAPYRTEPIECKVHVVTSDGTDRTDETRVGEPASSCRITLKGRKMRHLVVEAENRSGEGAVLRIAPALPGFGPVTKVAWLVESLFVALGVVLVVRGLKRRTPSAPS